MNPPMTYFRNYPEPYDSDWKSEPVPGWGVRPVMAGPARVGVGATFAAAPQQHLTTIASRPGAHPLLFDPSQDSSEAQGAGVPWWAWVGGAVLLFGGIGYFTARGKKR